MTCMIWIKDFQSLIVGIIGFAGVILTLALNAWLGRRDIQEQRRHARLTLRIQFVEELKINRSSLTGNLEKFEGVNEDKKKTIGFFIPTKTMDDIYTSLLDEIGLLSEGEIRKVMYSYLSLRGYYNNLRLISIPVENAPDHVNISPRHAELLPGMIKGILEPINKAIEALEEAKKRDA